MTDFVRQVSPPEETSSQTSSPEAAPTISTPEALEAYVWEKFGVRIPKVQVCPHHRAPWEAFCAAYFATSEQSVVVIKGSRGLAGKSWLVALLGNVIATTMRADVTILGGSGQQSTRVHQAQGKFWSAPNAPRDQLAGTPTTTKTTFRDGQTIEALTASQRSVRGPHPLLLVLDEVDEMDAGIFDAAMGQTMDAHGWTGRTVISSTHQHPDGTMTQVLKTAAERNWPVFEWCYRETLEPHGWLTPQQVVRKKNELTVEMWRVEVELGEPSIEGRAIDVQKVERMFVGTLIPGTGRDDEVAYCEFEPPVPGGSYSTGGDWARTRDFVEIATWRDDTFPLRLVAYQRFRKVASPVFIDRFNRQVARYPGTSAHDATGGGIYIADFLPEGTEDFVMQGMRRRALFTDYILAIEHEELVAPRIRPLYNQHKFVRNADLWTQAGHPPDGFVACALGYNASARALRPLRLMGSRSQPEPRQMDIHAGLVPVPEQPVEPVSALRRALNFGGNGGNGSNGGNGHGENGGG